MRMRWLSFAMRKRFTIDDKTPMLTPTWVIMSTVLDDKPDWFRKYGELAERTDPTVKDM